MEHAKRFNLTLASMLDFLAKIVPKKHEADLAFLAQGLETLSRIDATIMIDKFINGGYVERFSTAILNRDESALMKINPRAEIEQREKTRGLQLERRDEMIELVLLLQAIVPSLSPKTKEYIWNNLELMYESYLNYIKIKRQIAR